MDAYKRVFINTVAQYGKSVINVCLSLYSARIILDALGKSDYGLYVLVGGVVAMLGFVTNALVITTQRFISFYHGKGDWNIVSKTFSNSLFLHVVIAIVLSMLLALFSHLVVYSWLEVDAGRLASAMMVYWATIVILFITILLSPFKAVLIARENIVYISIIEVLDGVLKLAVAFLLLRVDIDKLQLYAWLMAAIQLFNLLAFSIYGCCKFAECSWLIRPRDISSDWLRRIMGFAGWTTYSMGAVVARNQGIAIMLNHFLKQTVINAAYGIAFQVYGALSFISSSILNAMNPRIMKAEGMGDRKRMLHLAALESKYSSLMLLLILVPLIFEMPSILNWWLKEVPENTVMFSRVVLIAFFFDQITYGLNTANQATGNVKPYVLLIYTPKLLILIPVYILLALGRLPGDVMLCYIIIEILCSFLRLPYMKYKVGLNVREFLVTAVVPLLPVLVSQFIVCYLLTLQPFNHSFLMTIILPVGVGALLAWLFALNHQERALLLSFIKHKGAREYKN